MTSIRTTPRTRRWISGIAAIGIGIVGLSSCTSGGAETSAAGSSSAAANSAPVMPAPASAAATSAGSAGGAESATGGVGGADAGAPEAAGGAAGVPVLDNRKIIRTADLQIRLDLPADIPDEALEQAQQDALDAAVNKARSQLIGLGGFVADLQQAGAGASLVLRVPAENYESFRNGAQEWGEVTSSTESARDVTEEYTDVESRITSMRTSVDRIRTLLSQATAVGDIIAIESELSRREADLESLEGRRQVLADQVSLGTVTVTLTAVRSAADTSAVSPAEDRGGFLGGLDDGWTGLKAFLSGVGMVLGAVLPFVPVMALVLVAAWAVRRLMRGRRRPTPATPTVDRPTPA